MCNRSSGWKKSNISCSIETLAQDRLGFPLLTAECLSTASKPEIKILALPVVRLPLEVLGANGIRMIPHKGWKNHLVNSVC